MITYPVVNMNGTSKQSLVDAYCDAGSAIEAAIIAMNEVAPNGRDFQTAPAGTYEAARREHDARILALRQIRDDLETIAIAVSDQ